jgi:hypothetical protein
MSKKNSGHGTAVAAALESTVVDRSLSHAKSPGLFCVELSNLFHLRLNEIALLRLQKGLLRFLFPEELKTAGSIPISSSSAVAAHTALTKKVELFNNFVKVKHVSIFETVKLNQEEEPTSLDQVTIQKLMSAPILNADDKVLGVIQVCRKGRDLNSCGPDFTLDDLRLLESAAKSVSKMPFMNEPSTQPS